MLTCLLYVVAVLVLSVTARFEWVDLTDEELKQWYTSTDLCMLESADTIGFPQQVRSKNCTQFSRGSPRLYCAVGLGSNKQPCFTPLVNRRSFKRGIKGYTDASRTPLMETFATLIRKNMSLVFVGDSMTRQKITALECELLRENRRNKFYGNVFGVLPCHSEFKIKVYGEENLLPLHVLAIGPKGSDCLLPHERRAIAEPGVHVFKKASESIDIINDNGNGIMIVANLGLWFNDEQPFEIAVDATLTWLQRLARNTKVRNVVAWHETSAQHWKSTSGSGYFEKPVADSQEMDWASGKVNISTLDLSELQVPNCCSNIHNTSFMADWRNDIVKMLIKVDARNDDIAYFPFVEATRPISDMHVCHQSIKHDCTHYCYWPLLWQPLWHQMQGLATRLLK